MSQTLQRKEFKDDDVFSFIFEQLKKKHEVRDDTRDQLIEIQGNEEPCVVTRHYAIMDLEPTLQVPISYETITELIYVDDREGFKVHFKSITMYDDQLEFDMIRKKDLFSSDTSSIPLDLLN